jgi:hypothetical protein
MGARALSIFDISNNTLTRGKHNGGNWQNEDLNYDIDVSGMSVYMSQEVPH